MLRAARPCVRVRAHMANKASAPMRFAFATRKASAVEVSPTDDAQKLPRPRRSTPRPTGNSEIVAILTENGIEQSSLRSRVTPAVLRSIINRLRSWGVTTARMPISLRRWQFSLGLNTPEELDRDIDTRISALKEVTEFTPAELTRLLARDSRVLWAQPDTVKTRYQFYSKLFGPHLVRKVVLRNPPLLTIDPPMDRATYWRTRFEFTPEEAKRVLKHSAIMNCRPDWVEIRIQLLTQHMGGNATLARSLIIAHGDLLLMSEQNLTDKFTLLDSYLNPAAYQQQRMVSKVAMALTRSFKESLMPRVKTIRDAGVGFARDDTTFVDFLIRTENTFTRLLNSRINSPLFLASRALASALAREALQPDSIGVHPNLLFPDDKLNDGVFYCIKQQLANDSFQFSRYTSLPLPSEPSSRPDNPVLERFLLEKSAYSKVVLLRRQSPMWTYLPIP